MTTTHDWQSRVGDVWAAEWRRTDRSFAELAPHLDAAILAAVCAGAATVPDIGCGAGATSAALAAARPDVTITGVDLSQSLVAVARTRMPAARFLVADVAADPLDLHPDCLVSRHGVMFFADPAAAFVRLRRLAAPGATLVFSCFAGRRTNAFAGRRTNAFAGDLVAAVTGRWPDEPTGYAPGPFAFADPVFVADLLATTGWIAAPPRAVDFAYVAGEGDDPVADAADFFARIGPVAGALAASHDPAAARMRLERALADYRHGTRVTLPASAWIWQARANEQQPGEQP